jgi:excisionase family DNA binding protein
VESPTGVGAAVTDAEAKWAYAARELTAYAARCRTDGVTMPVDLQALLALLANSGQRRPFLGLSAVDGDDAAMEALALDYRTVAGRLGVSDRTVRRLVRSRELPAVRIGGQPRVRTADLQEFVDGLDPLGEDESEAA